MSSAYAASYKIERDVLDSLRNEAALLEFVRTKSQNFGIKPAEQRITSPFDLASTRGTGACVALARSPALLSFVEDLHGGRLRFTTCNYLLYDIGSYIGLHTDRLGCEVNALFLLAGPPTVVELRPRTPAESIRALLQLSRDGDGIVEDAERIPLNEPGDAVVFLSGAVPHQRRPSRNAMLLLSVCFGSF